MDEKEQLEYCMYCGLKIEWSDEVGKWSADRTWEANTSLGPEPWMDACPGSIELLKKYPTFEEWSGYSDLDSGVHKPMNPLVKLVYDAF